MKYLLAVMNAIEHELVVIIYNPSLKVGLTTHGMKVQIICLLASQFLLKRTFALSLEKKRV